MNSIILYTHLLFQSKDVIYAIIIAPNNVNVVVLLGEDVVVVLPVLVEDSHPSNLKLIPPNPAHIFELYFNVDVGVFEQLTDPVYVLTCICSPLQVSILDDDVVESPLQIPGNTVPFICISPLQSLLL